MRVQPEKVAHANYEVVQVEVWSRSANHITIRDLGPWDRLLRGWSGRRK